MKNTLPSISSMMGESSGNGNFKVPAPKNQQVPLMVPQQPQNGQGFIFNAMPPQIGQQQQQFSNPNMHPYQQQPPMQFYQLQQKQAQEMNGYVFSSPNNALSPQLVQVQHLQQVPIQQQLGHLPPQHLHPGNEGVFLTHPGQQQGMPMSFGNMPFQQQMPFLHNAQHMVPLNALNGVTDGVNDQGGQEAANEHAFSSQHKSSVSITNKVLGHERHGSAEKNGSILTNTPRSSEGVPPPFIGERAEPSKETLGPTADISSLKTTSNGKRNHLSFSSIDKPNTKKTKRKLDQAVTSSEEATSKNNTTPNDSSGNLRFEDSPSSISDASPNDEALSSNTKKTKTRLLSCNNCRFRKIKCDNKFPCSSCTKASLPPGLCSYDSVPWISSAQQQQKMTYELKELNAQNKALLNQLSYYKNKLHEQELDIKKRNTISIDGNSYSIGPFNELVDPNDDEFIFSINELQSRYSTLVPYINNKNTTMVPKSKHLELSPHLFFGPFHFRSLMSEDNFINKIYKDLYQKSVKILQDNPYKSFIKNYQVKSKNIVNILKDNSLQIVIRKFNVLIDNPYHLRLLFDNFFNGYGSFLVNDLYDEDVAKSFFSKYFKIDLEKYDRDEGSVSINLVSEMQTAVNPEEIIYKLLNASLIIVISVLLGNTSDLGNEALNAILKKYRPLTQVIDLFINESLIYTSYKITPSYYAIKLFITWSRLKQYNQNYIIGFDSDIPYFFDILNTLSLAKNESVAMGLHCDIDNLYSNLVDDTIKEKLKQVFRSIMEVDISIIVYTGQPFFVEHSEKKRFIMKNGEDKISKQLEPDEADIEDKEFLNFIKFIRSLINVMMNLGDIPSFYYINEIQNYLKERKELLPIGKLEKLKASKMDNRSVFRLLKNFKNGFYLVNLMVNLYQNIERLMTDLNYPYKEPKKYLKTKNLSLQWTCLLMLLIREGIEIFDYLVKEYKYDKFFKILMVKEFKHSMIRCILYIGKLVFNSLRSMLSGLFKIQEPTKPKLPIDKISFADLYTIFDGSEKNAVFLEELFHKSQIKRLLYFSVICLSKLISFPPDLEFTDFKHISELIKNLLWFINENFKVEDCFHELDEDQLEFLSKTVTENSLKEYGINLNFFK